MKTFILTALLLSILSFASCRLFIFPKLQTTGGRDILNKKISHNVRCVNMWDDGCVNGQIPGSGMDDDFLNGGFNPGKRCANMWDDGCINGQIPGAGQDDDFLNGGFNPGKRCANMWDDGCINGQIPGAGQDDDFLNGNFNPGKRTINEIDFMKIYLEYLRRRLQLNRENSPLKNVKK